MLWLIVNVMFVYTLRYYLVRLMWNYSVQRTTCKCVEGLTTPILICGITVELTQSCDGGSSTTTCLLNLYISHTLNTRRYTISPGTFLARGNGYRYLVRLLPSAIDVLWSAVIIRGAFSQHLAYYENAPRTLVIPLVLVSLV